MRIGGRLSLLCAAALPWLLILGCGSGSSASTAQLRIINASPVQQDLDLLLDNNNIETGVVYESATGYTSEPTGNHTVQINQSGTSTSLASQSVTLNSGAYYTVLAVEPFFDSSSLTMSVLTDDNAAPSSGNMKLRIINASPDLGNLDAYVLAPGTDISAASPSMGNLPFQAASAYQTLAPGDYEIYVTLANQKVISVDSGPLTFTAGQIRTLVVLDNIGNGYTSALVADLN